MKITKIILLLFILIQIIPICSIIALSFQHSDGNILKWYQTILGNEDFIDSFYLSVIISILTSVVSISTSFFLSLSWFNPKQRILVLLLILIIGLLPPDIIALSISKIPQILNVYNANLLFLLVALVMYCLPIAILMFWSGMYFIENSVIIAAKDVGMHNFYVITKIILPLLKPQIISCFFLCFLLSFNEYPRTFYLSGSNVLVSEFLNGKLSSGTNESIYAGGSITVLITVALILFIGLFYTVSNYQKEQA